MNPATNTVRDLSPQEITIVEEGTEGNIKELAAQGYPDLPGEIEVCKMVKILQGRLDASLTSLDLALYLRRRADTTKPPALPALPTPPPAPPMLSFFKQFADPVKTQHPHPLRDKRDYICRSKRKIKPTQPSPRRQLQDLVQACDASTAECHSLFQKKIRKTFSTFQITLHEKAQWVFNQYFYSFFDRTYLKEEEPFVRLQQALRINPQTMTYYDSKALRQALPPPKIFNAEFLASQVQRLNQYRNQARSAPSKQRGKGEWQLSVGREVVALHPVCGHIHAGSILAIYKENLYMVKFVRPELGTQKIIDINIALREVANPNKIIVESVNFEVMALVIKLLEFKADLISLLGKYNDLAQEVQREQNGLDNRFYQQYGWIGSTINILSLGIRHILSRFRLRGLDSSNQQKIGRNFANVLLNPLNLMQKELDKSQQNSDLNASHQIKRIISNYKQSRVDQYTRQLFGKHWQSLKNAQWSPQQRDQFQILMRCLVGILVSLRVEHKGFSIEENKYLKELMNNFDNQYPEHFNEIYELLASITAKLNEEPNK